MSKTKNVTSISKEAFSRTKKTFVRKSTVLALFFVICVICLFVGIFWELSLILTVPFIMIPAFFALLSINTILDTNIETEKSGFFLMFRSYFSINFNGGFKVWLALLKSVITFIIITFIVSFVGVTIIYTTNNDFINELNTLINTSIETNVYSEIEEFLSTNKELENIVNIALFSSFGGATLMFIHSISIHSVKYYFNLLGARPVFSHDLNTIHSSVMKKNRRKFNKDYFKSLWFMPFILLLGYSGGIFFSVLVLNSQVNPLIVGLFGLLIFVLMFIPYYLDVTLFLFKKYQNEYFGTFINLSIETLKELKKTEKISPEKEKEILDFLNSQKVNNSDSEKTKKNKKSRD